MTKQVLLTLDLDLQNSYSFSLMMILFNFNDSLINVKNKFSQLSAFRDKAAGTIHLKELKEN